MPVRCLYVDLDRTLLGRAGSLFHDGTGKVCVLGARAVEACLHADVEIVVLTGRRLAEAATYARLFGQPAFAFEAGAGLVIDRETFWQTGAFDPHDRVSVHAQIARSGAPGLLLDHYGPDLELRRRKTEGRRVTHLFRGFVDAAEASELLVKRGHRELRLIDNGAKRPGTHTYHLAPAGTSKAAACARHRRRRGYARDECMAVGDSREDLGMAAHVGAFWLVANAIESDPSLADAAAEAANVEVTTSPNGAGVYEALFASGVAAQAPPRSRRRTAAERHEPSDSLPGRAVGDDARMAYDEDLANRIRELIAEEESVTEKRMFGGLAFLVAGNMSVAASGQGGLMVRVDPEQTDALVAKPHAAPMVMRGREMQGWLRVDDEGVRTKRQLGPWVRRGVAYARSLPAKT